MKRTNIVLDDGLVREAKEMTGIATVRGVVHHALAELIRHGHQRELLKFEGIGWRGNLAKMRRDRVINGSR